MGELNKEFTSQVLNDAVNKNYEGYNVEYGLLKILAESKKQTELLEKIYNQGKPPLVFTETMSKDRRDMLLKALESLDENKEEHLE